ncbi:Glutathione S-transferase, C-terminal domain protein [Aspergillus clavatus NRRL 1]|uniref:Glutathione S-transferase, C-terminal domain protein n=1 Tax=Aspergillus clavatus (strain ATCC 1007 / CBS 513.65 / DSM 816 / NCTC 3887 / NRRL 1 / QM 1276 / 107) TaxID=344612 RepID=A1CIX2_ASPCL|nr:Glutathione S-transferase, C-terminal domain protein [Aspergillus clavatus NRRL 1]EAW10827.1 Glutathione S-transferase, C-terminal domain protein [Aspergillus clavatus NRRL 1]
MNIFHEQSGRIALYTSPGAKEGATIAMLIDFLRQAHCIHLVKSPNDIKHDDASAYKSLPIVFDVTQDGKKVSAQGLNDITRYLLARYDDGAEFAYKEGSKEAQEVGNWLAFLDKVTTAGDAEESSARIALRLYLHLEEHIQKAQSPYLVGRKCTLADLTIFPYVAAAGEVGLDLERFPELTSWYNRLAQLPQVIKGMTAVHLKIDNERA